MNIKNHPILTLLFFVCCYCQAQQNGFEYNPKTYVCYQTKDSLHIDGQINEAAWQNAPWTDLFVDIEGASKPKPKYDTQAKMLWDEHYFYVVAIIKEPHIWSEITARDAVIFHENDFEVFIDPDGDTHQYYEFEINALGTHWDLMLIKPYLNGGPAINAWDIRGVKKGISIDGTLNDPSDVDNEWIVELAFPWKVLKEAAPERSKPTEGDQWRVNFSRVNWETTSDNGRYKKKVNPETGKHFPEHNWVWSPQGVINMHKPEYWGIVQFTKEVAGTKEVPFSPDPDDPKKWLLRNIYYAEKAYFNHNRQYTNEITDLDLSKWITTDQLRSINISTTPLHFQISIPATDTGYQWHIREDSKIWKTKNY